MISMKVQCLSHLILRCASHDILMGVFASEAKQSQGLQIDCPPDRTGRLRRTSSQGYPSLKTCHFSFRSAPILTLYDGQLWWEGEISPFRVVGRMRSFAALLDDGQQIWEGEISPRGIVLQNDKICRRSSKCSITKPVNEKASPFGKAVWLFAPNKLALKNLQIFTRLVS